MISAVNSDEVATRFRKRLREAVAKLGDIPTDEVSDTQHFEDQNVDSLGKLALIAIAETEYEIRISDAQAVGVNSIKDIVGLMNNYG